MFQIRKWMYIAAKRRSIGLLAKGMTLAHRLGVTLDEVMALVDSGAGHDGHSGETGGGSGGGGGGATADDGQTSATFMSAFPPQLISSQQVLNGDRLTWEELPAW